MMRALFAGILFRWVAASVIGIIISGFLAYLFSYAVMGEVSPDTGGLFTITIGVLAPLAAGVITYAVFRKELGLPLLWVIATAVGGWVIAPFAFIMTFSTLGLRPWQVPIGPIFDRSWSVVPFVFLSGYILGLLQEGVLRWGFRAPNWWAGLTMAGTIVGAGIVGLLSKAIENAAFLDLQATREYYFYFVLIMMAFCLIMVICIAAPQGYLLARMVQQVESEKENAKTA